MRTETSINFILETPGDASWSALKGVATEWNRSHVDPMIEISGIMFQLTIPNVSVANQNEIRALIAKLRVEAGAQSYAASRRIYSQDDYKEAAFIEVIGTSLDRPSRPFVSNEKEALGPPIACMDCGYRDIFNSPQTAPFVIEESFIDDGIDGQEGPCGGWDCVALPGGRLLLSRRLLDRVSQADGHDLDVRPVIASTTGRMSERAFQISAKKDVLVPCLSDVPGPSYCARCGVMLDAAGDEDTAASVFMPPPEFHVSRRQVAANEILSRHPSCASMLYFSQRLYHQVDRGRFNGIGWGEIIRACDEGC